jgi:hypothetical protein
MIFKRSKKKAAEKVSTGRAFKHLVVFQVKLGLDALRDLFLSPISVVVFMLDAIRKPSVEDSLYLRLMQLGRKSDRLINLFDEHGGEGSYTVDQTLAEVARVLERDRQARQGDKFNAGEDAPRE